MDALEQKQEAVNVAGANVRALKAQGADQADITAAIDELKRLKVDLEKDLAALREAGNAEAKAKEEFRSKLGQLLEGRLFYIPSYKIYGGVAGLYDYGPPGCAVKSNVQQFWRQHFVLEESMFEVECPAVTPEVVLQASGHVEKFTDLMVNDVVTKECFRADHLLEAKLEELLKDPMLKADRRRELEDLQARIDELNPEQMSVALKDTETKSPDTNNDLSEPYPFNLMFPTQIGPSGTVKGFLRPETAQGIFVNFRDLLYYNGGKLPLAAAQIGQSFRNEIAPRAGLLRVREFTQAEIEHFVHPEHKEHPRFVEVADTVLNLFSQDAQLGEVKKPFLMTVGEAVSKGIIANETLGYFIARCHLFLEQIGIDLTKLRFRQHLKHEMAHYAADCWDAEIQCSYGWIECVGLADRSAFDLKAHSDKSKVDLVAYERFDKPIEEENVVVTPNKKVMGKAFKKDAKAVTDALLALSEEDAFALQDTCAANGSAPLQTASGEHVIAADMFKVERVTKTVNGRNYTPSVIEPSFGIGRIMYCMFEHAFYIRPDDEQKTVLKLTPVVAPIKTTIFPLVNDDKLNAISARINKSLTTSGISAKLDTTAISVGKRYARTDELGVPFAVTVDHRSTQDDTVTVRERDSTDQVRVPIPELPDVLGRLCRMTETWEHATKSYEKQTVSED